MFDSTNTFVCGICKYLFNHTFLLYPKSFPHPTDAYKNKSKRHIVWLHCWIHLDLCMKFNEKNGILPHF